MYYQLRFAFQHKRSKWCKVHVKDKKRTWVGVKVFMQDDLPIWFAFNKLTGQTRKDKCLRMLRQKYPIAYGLLMENLESTFGVYHEA